MDLGGVARPLTVFDVVVIALRATPTRPAQAVPLVFLDGVFIDRPLRTELSHEYPTRTPPADILGAAQDLGAFIEAENVRLTLQPVPIPQDSPHAGRLETWVTRDSATLRERLTAMLNDERVSVFEGVIGADELAERVLDVIREWATEGIPQ
jgi:hypothetical protein